MAVRKGTTVEQAKENSEKLGAWLRTRAAVLLEKTKDEWAHTWLPGENKEGREDGPPIKTPEELIKAMKERKKRWICARGLAMAARHLGADILVYDRENGSWRKCARFRGVPEKEQTDHGKILVKR